MTAADQRTVDAWADRVLNRWAAVGLVARVVREGTPAAVATRGVADVGTRAPVTADTVFRIGSVTKTLTAVAVLQLAERGLVDLDAPVGTYLRSFRMVPRDPGWPPPTPRQLLTHTAGVPEWVHPSRMLGSGWFAETYAPTDPPPTLATYYHGALRLPAEPGRTWAYTDHGFAVLGQVVEDVTGQPLRSYLRERVFAPLDMDSSDLGPTDRVAGRLATGYRIGRRGPVPVHDRPLVAAAAGAVCSSPADLGRFVAALLRGGATADGRILEPATVAEMVAPQHQPDPRIPGMGLAFWRTDLSGHAAVEHQGVVAGSNCQIFLAPDDGVGVVVCANGTTNAYAATWLLGATEELLRELLGVPRQSLRTDLPQRPDGWGELCGWYRPQALRTDLQAWSMLGAGVEVRVRRGRLVVRSLSPIPALLHGLPLHPDDPDDPDVFRVDLSRHGMGSVRLAFGRNRAGQVTGLHLDGILLSARKASGPAPARSPAATPEHLAS